MPDESTAMPFAESAPPPPIQVLNTQALPAAATLVTKPSVPEPPRPALKDWIGLAVGKLAEAVTPAT